ncbi:fluoride efflux transporter CrcB [Pragia fontium]|uniref:Fluoride-specific ion channel FluC n=2 Tax=Pragia fontium TaxID=82985 RepID=A0AAJ4W9W6_9GAMM|nr:fluoride efflux transporter CrcB [Pragia fontium]AKJ43217.1 camphor resistance protein CrcB [Pragia fontium]SFC62573.1 CrcB protein [Pragia fontium DSM 5563 = ATCC 49100]SUB83661.1 camphor resistance protein CrcB [Pragia fontium]VEJ56566.1 camphor resistance protein CrcB [Pragia fontium]GKX64016.1 putative fluoride ion transporter CrcB [Pragia fontium]
MSHGITLMIVAFGGAVGAISRFQITHWFTQWFGNNFPYATLAVNVGGSLIMGLLMSALANGSLISPHWRPLIGVGFLGALTTFSTFSFDTLLLFTQGEWLKAVLNILLNVILCLIAVAVGYQLLLKAQ